MSKRSVLARGCARCSHTDASSASWNRSGACPNGAGVRGVTLRRVFMGTLGRTNVRYLHMGMFDGLLGGIVGAGMVSVVNNALEQHGGIQGVVNQFEKNGLGPSCFSSGRRSPACRVQELTERLAHVLPEAVDKLTPDGTVPKA